MSEELSWCEDSTNKENDYTRNKIRNELLPWVTENINSRAAEHILAVSEFAAQSGRVFRGGSRENSGRKLFKKKRRGETAKCQKCGGSRWKRAWDRSERESGRK